MMIIYWMNCRGYRHSDMSEYFFYLIFNQILYLIYVLIDYDNSRDRPYRMKFGFLFSIIRRAASASPWQFSPKYFRFFLLIHFEVIFLLSKNNYFLKSTLIFFALTIELRCLEARLKQRVKPLFPPVWKLEWKMWNRFRERILKPYRWLE